MPALLRRVYLVAPYLSYCALFAFRPFRLAIHLDLSAEPALWLAWVPHSVPLPYLLAISVGLTFGSLCGASILASLGASLVPLALRSGHFGWPHV